MAKDFPTRLRQLREEKDISQESLGKIISLDKSTISLYETGKREPGYSIITKLAEFFDCSIDYLLGRSDTRKPYEFNELDPETVKILNRANKLTPAAREQLKEAVKWVFELDEKERELERLRKGEGE